MDPGGVHLKTEKNDLTRPENTLLQIDAELLSGQCGENLRQNLVMLRLGSAINQYIVNVCYAVLAIS